MTTFKRVEMSNTVEIREEDFVEAFSMSDYVACCSQAFQLFGDATLSNPLREEHVDRQRGMDHFSLVMPAEWPGRYSACKRIEEFSDVSSGQLARREAYIELRDLVRDNAVRLDAGHITDMRTGAAGALALQYIATRPIRRIALLGTGRVARALTLACDGLFDLQEVRCTSRRAENRDAFARDVGSEMRAPLNMVATQGECMRDVDALLMAVPTPEPIVGVQSVEEIDYLVVMGGDSRTRQVESAVLERRPVLVDLWEQAEKSGEFRWARAQQQLERIDLMRGESGDALTIGDAALGRAGRPRACAYLTGLAVQDLCAAAMIYEGWKTRNAT